MAKLMFHIDEKLITVEKVEAYQGYANRVYLKEGHALVDLVTSELAKRFLSKVAYPGEGVSYAKLLEMAQRDPELFTLTSSLARLKTEVGA